MGIWLSWILIYYSLSFCRRREKWRWRSHLPHHGTQVSWRLSDGLWREVSAIWYQVQFLILEWKGLDTEPFDNWENFVLVLHLSFWAFSPLPGKSSCSPLSRYFNDPPGSKPYISPQCPLWSPTFLSTFAFPSLPSFLLPLCKACPLCITIHKTRY